MSKLKLGNCDKFYFTFEFEHRMWVRSYQKFEKDWIPICHLLNPIDIQTILNTNEYSLLGENWDWTITKFT